MASKFYEDGKVFELGKTGQFMGRQGMVSIRDLVIEVEEEGASGMTYTTKKVYTFSGDNALALDGYAVGDAVRVYFTTRANQGKDGRWFPKLSGQGIERLGDAFTAKKLAEEAVKLIASGNNDEAAGKLRESLRLLGAEASSSSASAPAPDPMDELVRVSQLGAPKPQPKEDEVRMWGEYQDNVLPF